MFVWPGQPRAYDAACVVCRGTLHAGPLDLQNQAIIGGGDLQCVSFTQDLFITPGLLEHGVEHVIIERRFMIKHAIVLDLRLQTQVNAYGVTGVAPIFLDGDHVGQRVHGVEDHQISTPVEVNHRLSFHF